MKKFLVFLSLSLFAVSTFAVSRGNLNFKSAHERYTVFSAGDDSINSYRIPSIIVANDGSITVFAEARRQSWQDKSRTDIVVKRSDDSGKTWSPLVDITNDTTGAYMDPTPVIDRVTGKIFLFCNFWPFDDHSGEKNVPYLITSDDNGLTWSKPQDISDILLTPETWSMGFGPGAGIQMKGGKFNGRLIMPVRLKDADTGKGFNIAFYSDDHGATWQRGEATEADNEFQIAEAKNDTLIYNARHHHTRAVARSFDGGRTWTEQSVDTILPGVSRGCQASVLRVGDALYFCGIDGIPMTDEFDERARLALYRSFDGGYTWPESAVIYEPGSGYACIEQLPDGRIVIVFEAAETQGFTRKSIPDVKPLQRPAGWMRLDVIIVDPV